MVRSLLLSVKKDGAERQETGAKRWETQKGGDKKIPPADNCAGVSMDKELN
jgi:hypothetical protein